jgi:tetratricopeptide (TPR) repeat protein
MRASDQISSVLEELRLGNTDQAIDRLGPVWRGIGKRPPAAPTARQTAENLLFCGILSSRLGAESGLKGAQETARDLLNESVRLFARLRDTRKHKAQLELALSYWRSGEVNEAFAYIRDLDPADSVFAFETALTKALLETELGKRDDALATLETIESSADEMPAVLRGQFHQERAVALRSIPTSDNLDRGLIEYQAALTFYEDAGCKKGESIVLNNLASIYRDYGQFQRAHSYAERSLRISCSLGNRFRIAEAEDQRALIFFAEGNYSNAVRLSHQAIANLLDSDHRKMLARVLLTLGRSLARLGKVQAAAEELERAEVVFAEIHDRLGLTDVRLTMLEELPLSLDKALALLQSASHLSTSTDFSERFNHAACQVGIQLIGEHTTYKEIDSHADQIKSKLIAETLAKYGGANTRGAIVRAARDLGITHTGLIWFLEHNEKFIPRKKRARTHMFAIPTQKRSA